MRAPAAVGLPCSAQPRGARLCAVLSLIALLGLGACQKDSDKKDAKSDPKTSTALVESNEKPAARAAAPEDPGIDVPTEEDFEEAVANQITPESDLQKELDQLEKEIAQ